MLADDAGQTPQAWRDLLSDLALARLAVSGGATRSDVLRDIGPFVAHKLSPSEWRGLCDATLNAIVDSGAAEDSRGRLALTADGGRRALGFLGARTLAVDWPALRDTHLTAVALGLDGAPQTRVKLLARPDGLRTALLQVHFGFKLRRVPTLSRVRAALAGIALKKAFGNTLPDEIRAQGGLNARTSRTLAGYLCRKPRDFGSDARLIAALAAEVAGVPQSDVASIRQAVLRRYINERLNAGTADDGRGATAVNGSAALNGAASQAVGFNGGTAPEASPCANGRGSGPGSANAGVRPSLEAFVAAISDIGQDCASGWAGSRKALIADVYDAVAARFPEWCISEVEFKSMLAEAHRRGHVMLAQADLKSRERAAAFQRSAIRYKNTVWHFIRLNAPQGATTTFATLASGNERA